MLTLVVGGTGTVGRHVVQGLLGAGTEVQVLSRSPEHAARIAPGARIIEGSTLQRPTLPPAFAGVDRTVLITPLSRTETEEGLAVVEAARRAGVGRLVYLSVHNLALAPHIPHFQSKVPIIDAIESSGFEYAIVEPNNFFQNDLRLQQAIVQFGIYPQPIGGIGLSRVDVRDVAEAIVSLTLDGQAGARHYPIVGPDVLTGEAVAQVYSQLFGRAITYAGDDLDAWADQARQALPGWLVDDLRVMFRFFQEHGLQASPADLEATRTLLGREPRRFADFARETVAAWTA